MDKIEKVYYINLDHRPDRRKEIEQVLSDLEIPQEKWERISATYDPNFGILGCAKSHIQAVESFIKSGHSICLIFEDDFIYDDKAHFHKSIQQVFDANVDFDMLQLSYNHNGIVYESTEYPFLKRVKRAGTSSGFLLHKKFAQTLLDNYKEGLTLHTAYVNQHNRTIHDYCFDVYIYRAQQQSKWYCFSPRLGHQRASYSDIEKKITDYGV